MAWITIYFRESEQQTIKSLLFRCLLFRSPLYSNACALLVKKIFFLQAGAISSQQRVQCCCSLQSRQVRAPASPSWRSHRGGLNDLGTLGKVPDVVLLPLPDGVRGGYEQHSGLLWHSTGRTFRKNFQDSLHWTERFDLVRCFQLKLLTLRLYLTRPGSLKCK